MRITRLSLCLLFLLSACAEVEMPIEPTGIDEMRKSPCACTEIEYQPETFDWVEVV